MGDCCNIDDVSCNNELRLSICSDFYKFEPFRVFSCPFETTVCGSKDIYMLETTGDPISIQSKPAFKRNKVCYYTITGPADASNGDLIYLKVISTTSVVVSVTIADDMKDTTPKIECKNMMTSGVLVARHPQQFYITFTAQASDGSGFFFQSYYSEYPTEDLYMNV